MNKIKKRLHKISNSFEGVLGNIGILFSANAIVAILGLCTLVVLTQSVGAAGLGILALVEAYSRTVDQVIRFEPSQAVIRYGTRALENNDQDNFRKLIKWATVMDICGAAIAAIIALSTLHIANQWMNLSPEAYRMAFIFTFTLFGYISATSVAVFRLLSKFGIYAKILVICAVVRFLTTAILWWLNAPLEIFFYLIVFDSLFQHLLPFVVAWKLLLKKTNGPIMTLPFTGLLQKNPGILRFIFNANINVLSRNSTRQFDIFLLGGLVGHVEIGLYQIAKRISLAALRISRPMQIVVYPRLTQLWERGESTRLVALVIKFNLLFLSIGAPVVLFFWIWGDVFIAKVFGAEFKEAKPLLIIQILASTIFMAASILNSALLSIDKDKQLLLVTLISSALFFIGITLFVPNFGIIAASWLTLVMNLVWSLGCSYFFFKATKYKKSI